MIAIKIVMKKVFFLKSYDVQDLHEIGINSYAFDIVSAIEYMYEAVDYGKLILGGDIIEIKDHKPHLSYDNWYTQKSTPEETLQDALSFLRKYLERNYTEYPWRICIVTS